MKRLVASLFWIPVIVVLAVLAVLAVRRLIPEVVTPQAAGIMTAIVPIRGALERYSLDTGAIVEFDLNHTHQAYQTAIPAIGNLVLAGSTFDGPWVMQIAPGGLGSPPDCFAVRLPAIDRPDAIEFSVEGGWHLRLPKTPTFRWKPYNSPAQDGSYLFGTRFCLNDRGAVTGQPPALPS